MLQDSLVVKRYGGGEVDATYCARQGYEGGLEWPLRTMRRTCVDLGYQMADRIESELIRGAAPLAVLQLLEQGEMYGYEMVDALARGSNGALALGQSTLYPLLYNLEAKGLLSSDRRQAPSGRLRKYYRVTPKGRRYLTAGRKRWRALTEEMDRLGVLGGAAAAVAR